MTMNDSKRSRTPIHQVAAALTLVMLLAGCGGTNSPPTAATTQPVEVTSAATVPETTVSTTAETAAPTTPEATATGRAPAAALPESLPAKNEAPVLAEQVKAGKL